MLKLNTTHAFAVDPARGVFMLRLLAIILGSALLLYAIRLPRLIVKTYFNYFSRESFLLLNNVFLTAAAATVLLGTLYPLILDALNLGKISVGAPYFNTVFVPISLLILFMMGIGPLSQWQQTNLSTLSERLLIMACVVLSFSILLPMLVLGSFDIIVCVVIGLALWVIQSALFSIKMRLTLQQTTEWWKRLLHIPLSHYGMVLAHIGFAFTAIGIVITSLYSTGVIVHLAPGQTVTVGPYHFHFQTIREYKGPNYDALQATVLAHENEKDVNTGVILHPEQRAYTARELALAKVAMSANLWRDLYVALGAPMPDGHSWVFRIYYKPFIRWIWMGGLFMLLGGFLAAYDRRYRRTSTVQTGSLLS